jgi:hypothetical protein
MGSLTVCRENRSGCKRPKGARSAPPVPLYGVESCEAGRRGYEKQAHKKYPTAKKK